MNRLQELFQRKNQSILSVFYTAGYPRLDDTVSIAVSLEQAGADIIEIGIPFSDPVADGPTIQQSNKVALDNGITLARIIEQVKEMRKTVKLPIILMGYINPVMQYGIEKFAIDAAAAGVDGVILPDMPLAEFEGEHKKVFDNAGLLMTFLISPTTSAERIRKIDHLSNGFIYAVSASSTTGARSGFATEQIEYFARLKSMKLKNPYLIGFGISNNQTFTQASEYSSGAIVGSAFVSMIGDSRNLDADIRKFVSELKGGKPA